MEADWVDRELRVLQRLVEKLDDERGGPASAASPVRPPDIPPTLQGGIALRLPRPGHPLSDSERAPDCCLIVPRRLNGLCASNAMPAKMFVMTSPTHVRLAQGVPYERGTWLFALAFALLLSHELDAMVRSEWEFFPGLNDLDSDIAADVFNLLHVPVFAGVIWVLTAGSALARRRTMIGVDVFLVVHAVAHTLVRGADRYEFEPPVETITVYGAAGTSLIHLALLGRWQLSQRPPR